MERSVGMWLLLCLVVVALADTEENDNAVAKLWALIVAGSNGYFNYRHQVRFVTVSHLWLYLDSLSLLLGIGNQRKHGLLQRFHN